MTVTLESITLRHEYDESPDTSHLGTYCGYLAKDYREAPDWAIIDRHAPVGEYPYFVGNWRNYAEADGTPVQNLKTGRPYSLRTVKRWITADYERLEGLGTAWQYIGVSAEARLIVDTGSNGNVWKQTQTIRSGGLWGVADDDAAYLDSVDDEQLEDLGAQLRELGIDCPEKAGDIRDRWEVK